MFSRKESYEQTIRRMEEELRALDREVEAKEREYFEKEAQANKIRDLQDKITNRKIRLQELSPIQRAARSVENEIRNINKAVATEKDLMRKAEEQTMKISDGYREMDGVVYTTANRRGGSL